MKPGHPDNRLIWEMYNDLGESQPTPQYGDREHDWKSDPPEVERLLDDVGVIIQFNHRVDDDDDRYYPGWEVYNINSKGKPSSTTPLDWTYSDHGMTLDDLEAQLRKQLKATGRPTFGSM